MKNFKRLPTVLLLTIILTLAGCKQGTPINADSIIIKNLNGINESKISEYRIDVDLDTENMTYKGKQTVSYVNNTDIDLDSIYFHLYPNAFKSLETAPILFDISNGMEASSYEPGYIEIEKVSNEGNNLKWNIDEEKDTILNVKLDKPLEKGKNIQLYLEYTVKLPTTEDRFGYHDKGINCGNWYPIVCVYDKKGWNLDPYYKVGDPFYSDVSDYKVSITTPKEIIVATSGRIISETEKGNKKTYKIEGQLIRDFAWAASKDFVVKEKKVEDTIIKVYSIKDDSKLIDETLKAGENSIKTFNKIFGKYPYGWYSIVNTEFPSGMEYPGMVLISNDYFHKHLIDILEKVIVHETAHQWWYGLVGNNQVDEAWLDEGLATYSEVIYMNEVHGKDEGDKYYNENIRLGYEYSVQYLSDNEVVNKPLSEFAGWIDYGPLVYSRAAMFIDRIKEDFGEEVLYKILSSYYDKYKFHIATTEDFIKVCEEVTNTSFSQLANEYLNGNK
ncbi:M1 family metallopeptidase [Tissierella praeacuta]|uniref:M1 family metallopeptidase n=1 Tax=Tissierella praeacuta TaxID=43131 RepID=UPI00333E4CD5